MFGMNWRRVVAVLLGSWMVITLTLGLVSCGRQSGSTFDNDRLAGEKVNFDRRSELANQRSRDRSVTQAISEVSPPEAIQELRMALDNHQPQIKILSPQPNTIFQDNTVSVQFQVEDLPLFKAPELAMGPHLHVILDNQPYEAIYDVSQPVVFKDLTPGTHTIRAFAARPWHESFKNEGAYGQTTFHVFTKTAENNPDPAQPILTYSRPKGSYGAEPILLDFYLTNAPLHLVAQEDADDDIADWRIRVTINGASFIMDRWQPLYLKGFKPGKNWVELEFLDDQGKPIQNVFNRTVRLINYEPGGQDTLSKLVRGDLKAVEARQIVDPNYRAKAEKSLPVTPAATPKPTPVPVVPSPEPPATPAIPQEVPAIELKQDQPAIPTTTLELPNELPKAADIEPEAEPRQAEKPKPGGFFNRFRRPAEDATKSTPNAPSTLPEVMVTPSPETSAPEVIAPPGPTTLEPKSLTSPGKFTRRFSQPNKTEVPAIQEDFQKFQQTPTEVEPVVEQPAAEDLAQQNSAADAPGKVQLSPNSEELSQDTAKSNKLDLRKVFLPEPDPEASIPIIQAPVAPEVPSRYLRNQQDSSVPAEIGELETPESSDPEPARMISP